jgi:regulator of CtrA degradation
MEADVARHERYRLGSREVCLGACSDDVSILPAQLCDLLLRSENLYRRIARLDGALFGEAPSAAPAVHVQQDALAQAFGAPS